MERNIKGSYSGNFLPTNRLFHWVIYRRIHMKKKEKEPEWWIIYCEMCDDGVDEWM